MTDARGDLQAAARLRYIGLDQPGRIDRIDDRLHVLLSPIDRRQERRRRRCSVALSAANGSRLLRCASRNVKLPAAWYAWLPAFVTISIRPRPGRAYSAEYGSWLIRIDSMAEADTPAPAASIPSTTSVIPPVPIAA